MEKNLANELHNYLHQKGMHYDFDREAFIQRVTGGNTKQKNRLMKHVQQKKSELDLLLNSGKGKQFKDEHFSIRKFHKEMGMLLNYLKGSNKSGRRGRKLDNDAAPQDLIESEVKRLVESGGKYLKNGKPKPTTLRDEIVRNPNIKLGDRAVFDRVKKALQKMQ